ncbi:MFS transporter [Melioribacter sp. OK-6-Me]|uniref:MFS transporter n=1 Tax=unclassified Melioribacter TaxID=2627329 RepID=UPI003ED9F111
MTLSKKIERLKSNFKSSFWVANGMELFERLAYYGQATILSIFLRDHLKFTEVEAGQLSSIFGGLIYLLPIFAGAIADKIGFKKAFSFAFGVLAAGYFLIGATGMKTFSNLIPQSILFPFLTIILIFTALGGSFIKPSVLGTVALSTTEETKSLGYAIYYWLVNIGAAIGPLLAYLVRDYFGIEFVYLVSAISCALMFIVTQFFYKNPIQNYNSQNLKTVLKNLIKVLTNLRFMTFLLIFGLYWVLFWQFFIIIPFYISDFISLDTPIELILSTGAWTIILFQIPVNRLTKKISTQTAIVIGFVFATATWLIWYFVLPITNGNTYNIFGTEVSVSIPVIVFGIFLFSIGEQTQAPRFYEYIADLAPKGQEALFQGYAFLPIALAWGFGGTFGGWVYQLFTKDTNNPQMIFLVISGIGMLATILMLFYNRFTKSKG